MLHRLCVTVKEHEGELYLVAYNYAHAGTLEPQLFRKRVGSCGAFKPMR
jgi:hypothetical protein